MASTALHPEASRLASCRGFTSSFTSSSGRSELECSRPSAFERSSRHHGRVVHGRAECFSRRRELKGQRPKDLPSRTSKGSLHSSTAPLASASAVAEAQGPVVVVDNYDSFTYNLCQYLGDLGCDYVVYRNDEITVDELQALAPRGVLVSPGPGTPEDSGISLEVVQKLGPTVPLFGVCMGHQCIGQAFGGRIVRAPHGVMHGKTSDVHHNEAEDSRGLLAGLPNPFTAARYHSLVIDRADFPEEELEVTAWTADGLIMGVRHRKYRHIQGVQFHPESIITQNGLKIVQNFINSLDLQPAAACH